MNWVAPIKDDTTLEKFKQKLREVDDKYYILFEIGVGTGHQPVYRRQRSGGLSDPRTFRFTGTAFQRTGLPRI